MLFVWFWFYNHEFYVAYVNDLWCLNWFLEIQSNINNFLRKIQIVLWALKKKKKNIGFGSIGNKLDSTGLNWLMDFKGHDLNCKGPQLISWNMYEWVIDLAKNRNHWKRVIVWGFDQIIEN